MDKESIGEPEHSNAATSLVSHAIARLQRVEVIRLDIGYQPLETLITVFVQRQHHPDRVEPFPAVGCCGESFVHVHVLWIEVQAEVSIDQSWYFGIPAITRESTVVDYCMAFISCVQRIDAAGYQELVDEAETFLRGKSQAVQNQRSEERRVGKECYALCRSRWSPYH